MTVILDRETLGPSWRVEGGRLRTGAPRDASTEVRQRIDCGFDPAATIRPGAVNAHTHLYSALAPYGMPAPATPPRNFLEILQKVWWRLDRALDERSLRASARLGIAQALLAGTTTLIDHHESPRFIDGSLEVIAEAAEELGARVFVCYGATERNEGRAEARRGLDECARFARTNRRPLVKGLVALHASFTASDDTLREAGSLARALKLPVHVHVAEDLADVEDAKRRGFAGPLERLMQLEAVPPGSILAHGVHLDETQVSRAEEAGLWLVQNPRSNEGNKVGYPHGLTGSTHVALGTDGWPAQMDEERDALLRLGRAHGDPPVELNHRAAGGWPLVSQLCGERLGVIEDGATADVVVGVPGAPPRHVLVGGRPAVIDGKLVGAELEELLARAREEAPRLWTRMNEVA